MVRRNEGTLWTTLEDQLVLLDVQTGRYYQANEVGALIWDLIEESRSIPEIVNQVVSNYRVEHEQCRQDVLKFVHALTAAGFAVNDQSSEGAVGLHESSAE